MVVEPSGRVPEFVVERFREYDEERLRAIVSYLTGVGGGDQAAVPDYVIELETLQDEETVTAVAKYAWDLAEAQARPRAMADGRGAVDDEDDATKDAGGGVLRRLLRRLRR